MAQRIFGTDGVRGKAGEGWLTAGNVSALGRHAGEVLGAGSKARTALVGHDGRRSGPELEAALARGLSAAGFRVTSVGLISTPGLALLTRLREFHVGGMISASHNPAEDNGVKLFGRNARKLSDADELAIEAKLLADTTPSERGAAPELDPELEKAYLGYLVDKAGAGLSLAGMTIALDCSNGGGSRIAPRVFGRLGARVIPLCAEPDGENINKGCGSTHPEALQAEVRRMGANVGIALDGDGDRCLLVDERGALVDGDGILTICGRQDGPKWPDRRVVATVMSNKGLHKALREVGVGVLTVGVGDRYVVEALEREKLRLGGEQSGHIVFGDDNYMIGDGVYTALRVLRVLRETGKPLSELAGAYRSFPQVLLNVRVARKPALSGIPAIVEAVAKVERELGDDGRVLLRYSGTESLARVMVEGPDLGLIQAHAQGLAKLLAAELGT
ncbi:MAG: phosphoglucosamine mutase [Planctomycetota bacterium]|nr:phosphoglucosamine mutase [Planctomycetota bacterium]